MSYKELFNLIDDIIGDIATFKGLTFDTGEGVLVIDVFTSGLNNDDDIFICDYTSNNSADFISFAAKGVEELKEQLEYYILK